MSHPYPPHRDWLPYVGKHRYSLTFRIEHGARVFEETANVDLVLTQFLRAATRCGFEVTTYCFMPDHVHLIVSGERGDADLKAFVARAKQSSGFYFKRERGATLWQRYGFEHVIRDDVELALTIGYVMANPVRAGLVAHPSAYPHLGSSRFSVAELLAMCEYERMVE